MPSQPGKRNRSEKSGETDSLRSKAEAAFTNTMPPKASTRHADELLHELQVHQIELEMQNEALRESQLALEESRDRYADLYEFAPVGFITLSAQGLIEEINLTGSAWLGVPRGKLIGRRFASFISQAEQDHWQQLFISTLKHGIHKGCSLMMQRRDGSQLYAQLSRMHPVTNGNMTVVRLAFIDTTEQEQSRANEHRLRQILDSTMDMIFIFSLDTLCFVYINKGAIKRTGYSREEMLQMTLTDILPMASEAECRAFFAPLVSGSKESLRFETTIVCKGDRELPVETQLQLVRENGGSCMFVAIVRDITKRKKAERELRRQKNLMWQVIDTDPSMIFVKDKDGNLLLANRAVADFYGVGIQDLIGRKYHRLKPAPHDAEQILSTDREVIESGCEVAMTEPLVREGRQHWFHTIKRPLMQDDGSVNVLGIATNITELKTSQNRLAESYRELQRLSLHLENIRAEERMQIGRNLHDEMGAILAALKMRVSWLSARLPGDMPHLRDEAAHISELISDGIHTVRQITSELRPDLLKDVGLSAAIRNYAKKFQRDTEIECIINFADEYFSLDENQSVAVFHIIQESLNNIAKHSNASKVVIRASLLNGALQLQIEDNGIGFDPKRKVQSFGLLGIRERALMIAGEATITSAPGHGTSVKLIIPRSGNNQDELPYS